jgi:hypothetical protein
MNRAARRRAARDKRSSEIEPPGKSVVDIYPLTASGGGGVVVSDSGTTQPMRLYDSIEFKDAKVRDLENGYVAAMPRIARTGIQMYLGSECGRNDMEVVRVYRPPTEVFHKDAMHSYTHLPVTLDHPKVSVNASNWKDHAIGETGDEVLRDGGSIRVPMMLRDAKAIQAFREGTKQLSVGYDCDLEWKDGITEDGEPYDAIQHGIKANHLAVVAAARGGATLSLGDTHHGSGKGDITMNLKTILVDGLEVQVADTAATVIQRTLASLESKYNTLYDKFKKKEDDDEDRDEEDCKKDAAIKAKDGEIVTLKKTVETKDGEIAALKTQLADSEKKASPAAIDAAARERAGVINKAQTIMGAKLKTDGMSVPDIRRSVVEARIGNCKDWSDDRVGGAFDAIQGNAFSQQQDRMPNTTMDDAVRVFGRPGSGYQSPAELRDKVYGDYDSSVSEAWRNKASA